MLTIKETKELLGAEKPIICTSLIDTFNTYVRRRTMAKKERKELTEYQLQRKAEREADGAMAQADRREVKKERKSVVKEVHKERDNALTKMAEIVQPCWLVLLKLPRRLDILDIWLNGIWNLVISSQKKVRRLMNESLRVLIAGLRRVNWKG